MIQQSRNVILVLDDATVHPKSEIGKYSYNKIVIPHKNFFSYLQL